MFKLIKQFSYIDTYIKAIELSPNEKQLAILFNTPNLVLYEMDTFSITLE